MPSRALRQPDLFQETPDDGELGVARLTAAFAEPGVRSGFLPLAEEALQACPGDPQILLMAATSALLDARPERALVFLKRFSKRAEGPGEQLLRALALNLTNKRETARLVLESHGWTTWMPAYPYFFGGRGQLGWLVRQIDEIMGTDRNGAGRAARAKPTRTGKVATKAKPKPGPKRPAQVHQRTADEPRAVDPIAPPSPPLPRIDIDIPLTLEIDLDKLATVTSREPEPDGRWFGLRERLAHLALAQGFDELLCPPHLIGVEPLWHQIETVRKVLKQFRGRVLLADEVGLGKTIEAGMVLKEYAMRGMAERARPEGRSKLDDRLRRGA